MQWQQWLMVMGVLGELPWAGAADTKKQPPVVGSRKGKRETVAIFNGKYLTGWVGHKDGVIIGKNPFQNRLDGGPTSHSPLYTI